MKCDASSQVAIRQEQTKKSNAEVKLLVKVTDNFNANNFRKKGIVVGSKIGNIVTMRVPADKISLLENSSEVVAYNVARRVQPTLNQVRRDTRTDSVHQGLGLPQAYTGAGVLIGVTDWGFDYTHPNYNNNGTDNRRILRAWDQFRLAGPAPSGYDYGTELADRAALIAAKSDTSNLYNYGTHGTHVSGIAAGRGIEGNYQGQAPDANLLMASFMLDEYSWVDAAAWMKDVAKEEGKRLVINCSWGMYTLGPIDGTSLASEAINNLADSGVVIVTSGGNNGNDKFHVSKTFVDTLPDTLHTIALYYDYNEIGTAIPIWGEPGRAFRATLAFGNDSEYTEYPWINTADGDEFIDDQVIFGEDTVRFKITVERSCIFNQRPHMAIVITKNAHLKTHLMITADEGTVHAWNLCELANGAGNMGAEFSDRNIPGYTKGDDEYGIGEPACAERCIAVAAHLADWFRNDGTVEVRDHAGFSSHGPVIDGRHKPDVSAPGVNVVSSISYYTDQSYTPIMTYTYASRNYIWARMSGTSMSSPAVTGIVALMLEANPDLTPMQVREILMMTARNDSITGPLHERDSVSNIWGWGKVDALAAVNEALARVDIREADETWMSKSLQVYPNPASTVATVYTGRHTPEEVVVYTIDGRIVVRQQITIQGTLDVSHLDKGIYVVRCGARTAKLIKN